MREVLAGAIVAAGLVVSGTACAQSAYGYVGSSSVPYLGYVGGGGGPYVPNYGQFVIGVPVQPVRVTHTTQTVVITQINTPAPARPASRRCGAVVLTVPDGQFEPFSACPPGGVDPQTAPRQRGPRIIRVGQE